MPDPNRFMSTFRDIPDLVREWFEDRAAVSRLEESFREADRSQTGQPNFFSKEIEREPVAAPVAVVQPTQTAAYKIEHAYHDKHFPSISQEQRDAARTTSAVSRDSAQGVLMFTQMAADRARDVGLER